MLALDARSGDGRARLRRRRWRAPTCWRLPPRRFDVGFALDADAAEVRPGLVEVCLDVRMDRAVVCPARLRQPRADECRHRRGRHAMADEVPTPLPVQALDHATGYLLAAEAVDGLRDRWNTWWVRSVGPRWPARPWLTELAGDDGPPLADAVGNDATPETTSWGPGHRRPPVTISGAPVRWDRGACHLGSADPEWPPARSRAS
ncbi:MAG: hypothetical protein R2713_11070 [Ilumatobacteraceae bacterium]